MSHFQIVEDDSDLLISAFAGFPAGATVEGLLVPVGTVGAVAGENSPPISGGVRGTRQRRLGPAKQVTPLDYSNASLCRLPWGLRWARSIPRLRASNDTEKPRQRHSAAAKSRRDRLVRRTDRLENRVSTTQPRANRSGDHDTSRGVGPYPHAVPDDDRGGVQWLYGSHPLPRFAIRGSPCEAGGRSRYFCLDVSTQASLVSAPSRRMMLLRRYGSPSDT